MVTLEELKTFEANNMSTKLTNSYALMAKTELLKQQKYART